MSWKCGCGGSIVPENGYLVCNGCGEVRDRHIVILQDYPEDRHTEVLHPDSTLTGNGTLARKEKKFPQRQQDTFWRYRARAGKVAHTLELDAQVGRDAFDLAKRLRKHLNPRRGQGVNLLAASFLAIIRQRKYPITVTRLAEAFNEHAKFNRKGMLQFIHEHDELIEITRCGDTPMERIERYLPLAADLAARRFLQKNGHKSQARQRLQATFLAEARDILREYPMNGSPQTLAACAVYAAGRYLECWVGQATWEPMGVCGFTVRMQWSIQGLRDFIEKRCKEREGSTHRL